MRSNSSLFLLAVVILVVLTPSICSVPTESTGEFKLEKIDPSSHIPDYYAVEVPWFHQEHSLSCGPACLKMVFANHGWTIDEREIQQAANMKASHGGTWTGDMVRAAHFSNMSTALDNASLQGYSLKPCGSDSVGTRQYEEDEMDLLRHLLIQDQTPILLMWYTVAHSYGHYRVLRGYDDVSETLYFADPMGYNATLGVNWTLPYDDFINEWWSYSGYWLQVVSDWEISIDVEEDALNPSQYAVNTTITTGIENDLRQAQSILRDCSAKLSLPNGWELTSGTEEVSIEINQHGIASAQWSVTQENQSALDNITVTASGFVGGETNSYDSYEDIICASETVNISALEKPSLEEINITHTDDGLELIANIENAEFVEDCRLLWRDDPTDWHEVAMEESAMGSFTAVTKIPAPGTAENESLQLRFALTDRSGECIRTEAYDYSFYESPIPTSPVISPLIPGAVAVVTLIGIVVIANQLGLLKFRERSE